MVIPILTMPTVSEQVRLLTELSTPILSTEPRFSARFGVTTRSFLSTITKIAFALSSRAIFNSKPFWETDWLPNEAWSPIEDHSMQEVITALNPN